MLLLRGKAACERGLKVAISGLGGDELFGGYSSFHEIPRWVRWLAVPSRLPFLGTAFRRGASAFASFSKRLSPKAASLLEYGGTGAYLLRRGVFVPWELGQCWIRKRRKKVSGACAPFTISLTPWSPASEFLLGKVAALKSSLYMRNQLQRDTDWASIAHFLKVRTPLVDVTLLKQAVAMVPFSDGPPKRGLAPIELSVELRK